MDATQTSPATQWVAGNNKTHKRWAVADIAYVREQCQSRSAQEIADDLKEPVGRVRSLIERLKPSDCKTPGGDHIGASVQIVSRGATSAQNQKEASAHQLPAGDDPRACFEPPAGLRAFVVRQSCSEVARALKISRSAAYRLRDGYWPFDARKLLAAWDAYKGRSAQQQSRWFLRRVQAGGVVLHAGCAYSAPGMGQREGQTLACARSSAGLLAQTLELPSARFELAQVEG